LKIITYEEKYRDDLIFMILEAKDSIGRIPSINPDLLNIKEEYLDKGDSFWLLIDVEDRVIGSISYSSLPNSSEVFLHRFFIKSKLKNKGLGSKLLYFVEDYLKKLGKTKIRIHLGQPKNQWIESYYFYQKKGYKFYKKNFLQKNLDTN